MFEPCTKGRPDEPVVYRQVFEVPQVLVGREWEPVQLTGLGSLELVRETRDAEPHWQVSPSEFARLYQRGHARMLLHLGTIVDPDVVTFGDVVASCAVPWGSVAGVEDETRGVAI